MPKPTLSFLIPSLKDEEKLECRVYIPKRRLRLETPPTPHSRTSTSEAEPERLGTRDIGLSSIESTHGLDVDVSRKKAAIIAHPYAPLGGSFDDNVVQEVTRILLDHGFIVGTFNFRGAGQSKGHTSWSAKPEVSDYMAFVGFMAVFMTYLDIHLKPSSFPEYPRKPSFGDYGLATIASQGQQGQLTDLSPKASTPISPRGSTIDITGEAPKYESNSTPLMLMAGYSYGSLITQLLPSLPDILKSFAQPSIRTPTSEIRFRAREMADVQNRAHFDRLAHEHEYMARHTIDKSGAGIRVGSEEDHVRKSRRSLDHHHHTPGLHLERLEKHEWARKSVDRVRSIRRSIDHLSPTRKKHHSWVHDDGDGSNQNVDNFDAPTSGRLSTVTSSNSSRPATSPTSEVSTHVRNAPGVLSSEDAEMFSDPVLRTQLRSNPSMQQRVPIADGTLLPSLTFQFTPAYLLISPIQGALGGLATMFQTTSSKHLIPSIPLPFLKKKDKDHKFTESELKLVHHPALAVFGGNDGFSSVDMMRKWTQALRHAPGSSFQAVEVARAGHFWHDHGHLDELKTAIKVWIGEIE